MQASSAQVTPQAAAGRIDRAWFDTARYPSVMELPIRFDDLDVLWHVNNVAVISLLQEARVHFNRTMALPPLGADLRTVVAAMVTEYGGELNYPGTIAISSGVLRLGRTSYTFGQLIRQNGVSAVYSQITMVMTDANGPAALPESFRSAIEQGCLIQG